MYPKTSVIALACAFAFLSVGAQSNEEQEIKAPATCYPNGDSGPGWCGYNCKCPRARDFLRGQGAGKGCNCWENTNPGNYGVGCSNGPGCCNMFVYSGC